MDFGDIFFIAVFIIIIVSNVYKQMKKARLNSSGGEASVKKTGWKSALELILEEARKQMENQARKESGDVPAGHPTGWENILSKSAPDFNPSEKSVQMDKTGPETVKPAQAKPEKSLIKRSAPLKAPEKRERPLPFQEKPSPARERVVDTLNEIMVRSEPVAVPKDYYADKTDKKRPRHLSQDALRNAVVWAEILAPPVGLRDME